MSIDKVVSALEKSFGSGIIKNLNEQKWVKESISTGSLTIDDALGGGLVQGKIHEIIGREASGKTTIAIHCAVEAQKYGKVVWIDMEHAFDKLYASNLGLNVDELLFSQPDYQEMVHEVTEAFARCDDVSLIVIDSVAALSPKAEMEGDSGDALMGKTARLMGQHLRKLTPIASKHNTTILFINQLRANLNTFGFGSKWVTPGGNALKYFSSVRMEVVKTGTIKGKENEPPKGIKSKLTVLKSRSGPAYRVANFEIKYGEGVDKFGELVDMAVSLKVVSKAGTWFTYGDVKVQGREAMIDLLKTDNQVYNNLYSTVIEMRTKCIQ